MPETPAELLEAPAGDTGEEFRAEWDAAYINNLPDSAFAIVLPGGEKDESGRTVPRDLRKLPHHGTNGDLDMPHLRNALSREPQTDMTDSQHSTARGHLQRHAESEGVGEETRAEDSPADPPGEPSIFDVEIEPADIQVRSAAKRELDVRLFRWGHTIESHDGPEEFRAGATIGTPDDGVLLMGLEHEAFPGLDQNGKLKAVRKPQGRSIRVWEEADGPHVTFKVARTQAGDELLALAEDGIIRGISPEFFPVTNGTAYERRNGRRVKVHHRIRLTGASMTYRPAYGDQATVLAVRSRHEEDRPVGDMDTAPEIGAEAQKQFDTIAGALASIESRAAAQAEIQQKLLDRLDQQAEQFRASFEIPSQVPTDKSPLLTKGQWFQLVGRSLSGDRLTAQEVDQLEQMRALDDLNTTDNAGVVPPAYLSELIGVIDKSRPFLSTTRRLETPESGMQMIVPVITQRPTVARQMTEKAEVDSTKTIIGTESFDAQTLAGAGDLSLQLIKRSSPSFLALWLDLLAEAYAIESEEAAILALANAMGGFGAAGPLNPASLALGSAFVTSFDAIRRPPDTIWLSTQAVGEFIDAKATTTNQPLYPGLAASATAAGGITGVISGLRPVHVPELDAHGAYAIVGPSSGFAWAEDGTYTLQADVPSKAGRDVALVGILWPAPWYPAAFTSYNVAS